MTMTSIDQHALDELLSRARREIDGGHLPACQIAVGFQGELIAFETYGDATADTRFLIMSCTKAITSAAAWALIGDGVLDPAHTVAQYIPEFAANGKQDITVEQVLTHTSGFPHAPLPFREWTDRPARLARYQTWRTNWEPGSRFEYHPGTAQWVIADVVAGITGQDFRQVLRDRVLDPLGLHRLRVGLVDQVGPFAEPVGVGDFMSAADLEAVGMSGVDPAGMAEIGLFAEQVLLPLGTPEALDAGLPGGGGLGTAADLALLYQGFIHNPGEVWDPATLADATGTIRSTLPDQSWSFPSNRALGVVVRESDAGIAPSIGGKASSGRAFGHDGAAGQIAWGDPVTGISIGYVTNGLERNQLKVHRRAAGLNNRVANVNRV
jgi:CubicO group peptidase (beta-lactamase class C family)